MAMESAFQNSLILSRICSFTSLEDLLNLRLTNRKWYHEATVVLKQMNVPIKLNSDSSIISFIASMKNRMEGEMFPFNTFAMNLFGLSHKQLWDLAEFIAPHVTCFKLSWYDAIHRVCCMGCGSSWMDMNIGKKLGYLLANVPNLREIEMSTHSDIHLNARDAGLISEWMPSLQVVSLDNWKSKNSTPGFVPLSLLLISRSGQLSSFSTSATSVDSPGIGEYQIPELSCLRGLSANQLPITVSITSEEFQISPQTLPAIQDIIEMKLSIKHVNLVAIVIVDENDTRNSRELAAMQMDPLTWARFVTQLLWDWLSQQSDHLAEFRLSVYSREAFPAVRLPILRALTKLHLEFDNDVDTPDHPVETNRNFYPIHAFENNQFPSLNKLKLIDYFDHYGAFTGITMPSVRKITLIYNEYCEAPTISSSWERTFPNLRCLHLYLSHSEAHQRSLISFILTHLAYVTELKLIIRVDQFEVNDDVAAEHGKHLWGIFTGGTLAYLQPEQILSGDSGPGVAEIPAAIEGIYETPSLVNLKNLKTLILEPGYPENLDALVYLTRRGLMVALDKLVVIHTETNRRTNVKKAHFEIEEGYVDVLAGHHGVVQIK